MTVVFRAVVLIAALLLAPGCGASDAGPDGVPTSERPASRAPTLGRDSPPPAWLETEGGRFWLGYSSYCWGGTCADYITRSCHDTEHVPTITVRRGETVTAHLGFEPDELTLSFFSGERRPTDIDQQTLTASRRPSWTVEREGAFSLLATTDGGDASYVACARFAE